MLIPSTVSSLSSARVYTNARAAALLTTPYKPPKSRFRQFLSKSTSLLHLGKHFSSSTSKVYKQHNSGISDRFVRSHPDNLNRHVVLTPTRSAFSSMTTFREMEFSTALAREVLTEDVVQRTGVPAKKIGKLLKRLAKSDARVVLLILDAADSAVRAAKALGGGQGQGPMPGKASGGGWSFGSSVWSFTSRSRAGSKVSLATTATTATTATMETEEGEGGAVGKDKGKESKAKRLKRRLKVKIVKPASSLYRKSKENLRDKLKDENSPEKESFLGREGALTPGRGRKDSGYMSLVGSMRQPGFIASASSPNLQRSALSDASLSPNSPILKHDYLASPPSVPHGKGERLRPGSSRSLISLVKGERGGEELPLPPPLPRGPSAASVPTADGMRSIQVWDGQRPRAGSLPDRSGEPGVDGVRVGVQDGNNPTRRLPISPLVPREEWSRGRSETRAGITRVRFQENLCEDDGAGKSTSISRVKSQEKLCRDVVVEKRSHKMAIKEMVRIGGKKTATKAEKME